MAEEAPIKDEERNEDAPETEDALETPDEEEEEKLSLMERATKGLREATPRKITGALSIVLCGLLIAAVGYWISTIVEDKPFERIAIEDAPPEVQEWMDDNRSTLFTGRRTIGDYTYVYATYGRRTTEGYDIEILHVEERVLNVTVYVEFSQPDEIPDERVLNFPEDLIRFEATRFPVTFERIGLPN